MKIEKQHGNKGNKNAKKSDDDENDAVIYIRLPTKKKNAYVKAAGDQKLYKWIIETLDKEAQ
ncbi:hypothetical protein UFOVP1367_36 [uncultured Caudovirales phage]|uniref:Uncharacterized protein n=1 Tax=uncultured Caudovirales phage TaxID=2100421 RepID=A0A6J5S4S9_9CAUD|nr:hypothetical protein KNT69_gp36 [uncultured Caudovirales phage]CAB4202756.1 hypothetical protein UFOVP1367_36 [uncultured Caudovirales phage]